MIETLLQPFQFSFMQAAFAVERQVVGNVIVYSVHLYFCITVYDAVGVIVIARTMIFAKIVTYDVSVIAVVYPKHIFLFPFNTHAEWALVQHIKVAAIAARRFGIHRPIATPKCRTCKM